MTAKKPKIATPAAAKIGRPPIPEEERAVVYSIRLTPARIEKFKELGGAKWLSARIDRAKLP